MAERAKVKVARSNASELMLAERRSTSLLVGVNDLARMFGKSRDWASKQLRDWYAAQLAGGPTRVHVQPGPRGVLKTTMAVIHQHMPGGRDIVLYRRAEELDGRVRELERRLDGAVREIHVLRQRLDQKDAGRRR